MSSYWVMYIILTISFKTDECQNHDVSIYSNKDMQWFINLINQLRIGEILTLRLI